ncbi:zinc dependent phospholipase C family protein [Algoriphagus sp. SE2]|uniref:zinc dependent phospholipase C family protein n=1 Tax=Algoriphagus sp. SE2 TaxID=3141536 RepID=UPI0031CD0359
MVLRFILVISQIFYFYPSENWGFYAHSLINRLAVYSLPPELIGFYKPHIQFITEKATNPDRRRYAVKGEAEKHYIDLDEYGENWSEKLPEFWFDAVEKFSEDSLRSRGIGPWSAYLTFQNLTKAFEEKNTDAILKLSADLGHYLADLNVPLHTTKNYNGQLTGQEGIHGFWESRIPELQAADYQLWVGKAEYIEKPQSAIWDAVKGAHAQVDSVLTFEKILTNEFSQDQKYSFEERSSLTVRVYSKEFSEAFAQALDHQIERQMKNSIKMIADFWFTAWVNAGQPDLPTIANMLPEEDIVPDRRIKVREH